MYIFMLVYLFLYFTQNFDKGKLISFNIMSNSRRITRGIPCNLLFLGDFFSFDLYIIQGLMDNISFVSRMTEERRSKNIQDPI